MRGKAAARRPNATPRHVSDLVPDPENRRKHNARNLGMVVDALQHVGAARSIVIDEDNVILAGNGVTEAAGQAGITKVRVVEAKGDEIIAVRRSGLTAEQKRALAIYDNRAGELAEWNPEQLRADVDAGLDLHPWFSTAELASVLPKDVKAGRTDPDEVPAERPTDIAVGDMFELGRHRVICGDSTIHETVERVVGDHADIAFTSPPYGAGNVAKIRDHYVAGAKHRRSFYAEHKDDPSGWLSLMNGWFRSVRPRVDAVLCNIQQLADNKRSMIEWVYENRDDFCDVVVWDKGNAAPQMQKERSVERVRVYSRVWREQHSVDSVWPISRNIKQCSPHQSERKERVCRRASRCVSGGTAAVGVRHSVLGSRHCRGSIPRNRNDHDRCGATRTVMLRR